MSPRCATSCATTPGKPACALEREVGKICRKVIKQLLTQSDKAKAEGKTAEAKVVNVTGENLSDYLGVRRYTFGMAEKENQIGQVTGLA